VAYRVSREKLEALILASALAGSGVQACRRSGALRIPCCASDKGGPAFDCAGHAARNTQYAPRLIPEPSPRAWAHWWRSRSRPRTVRHTIRLNGHSVELFQEALLPGWQYPCTSQELEAALRSLPPAWTAHLRSVRLTFHPEWDAYARTDRARIEISYIVDAALCAPGDVSGDTPEELQFGARLVGWHGEQRVIWPDREALRIYILRHILIHEIGHCVAPGGLGRDEEEDWAEAFAYRYYTPPAARPIAAAR
jgi:hypothetical protein